MKRRFPEARWLPDEEPRQSGLQPPLWLGVGDTPIQILSGDFLIRQLEQELQDPENSGAQYAMIGVGAETETISAKRRIAALLERFAFITTRDGATANFLVDDLGVKNPEVLVGADLSHLAFLTLPPPLSSERPIDLAVNFFVEQTHYRSLFWLSRFLREQARRKTIVWLANETRSFRESETDLFTKFAWLANNAGQNRPVRFFCPDYCSHNVFDLVKHFDSFGTVLSSRYHALLTAGWRGCRVCGIARSSKVVSLCGQLGIPTVPFPFNKGELQAGVEAAVTVDRTILRTLAEEAGSFVLHPLYRNLLDLLNQTR